MFVKICGITRPQDAELAIDLGASAVGFIFWPGSPRLVDSGVARTIAGSVPDGVKKVGVFVDAGADDIMRTMDAVGLDIAQLHGHESPEFCRQLSASGRTVIKAVGLDDDGRVNFAAFDPDLVLLVDAHDPERFGGTGKTANWDAARDIAATRPLVLAGGLTPDNVAEAVSLVAPWGVDVASGVEQSPGVKDPARVRAFVQAVRAADGGRQGRLSEPGR